MITVALLPFFHAAFSLRHTFNCGKKEKNERGGNNGEIKTLSHKFGWEISSYIFIFFFLSFFPLDLLLFRTGSVQCMVVKTGGIISCSRLSGLIRVLFIRVNWYLKSFPLQWQGFFTLNYLGLWNAVLHVRRVEEKKKKKKTKQRRHINPAVALWKCESFRPRRRPDLTLLFSFLHLF